MIFTKHISVETCFNKAVINSSEILQDKSRIYVKYCNKLNKFSISINIFDFLVTRAKASRNDYKRFGAVVSSVHERQTDVFILRIF